MGDMRHPSRNLRQRVAVGAVGVLSLATVLSGCDLVNKPPTPDQAAKALAGGLAGGDLNQVRFDGATSANVAAFLATAVGDLKDVKRTVTVSQVSEPKSNDRTATASLGYTGDSIFNSLGDIASFVVGFWVAKKVGLWWSVAIFVAVELLMLWWIRDNLALNVLMLLWPIDAIRKWQAGA